MKKILLLGLCYLAACSNSPVKKKDSLETFNRSATRFNVALDTVAIKPAATAYKSVTTVPVRNAVSNFLHNLHMPFSAVFRLLAGDPKEATKSIWRFVINTTLGLGGIGDPAYKLFQLTPKEFYFSDTLGSWGIGHKPYIVLPVLGPSSPRGIIGFVGNIFLDPLHYIYPVWFKWAQKPIEVISERTSNFEAVNTMLYKTADPYTNIKNIYLKTTPTVDDIDLSDYE